MTYTIVGFVDGEIPFIVTETPFLDWRCCIPTLPDGGGENRSLAERTAKCPHRTHYLVGRAPTCAHHIRYAALTLAHFDERRLPSIGDCELSA